MKLDLDSADATVKLKRPVRIIVSKTVNRREITGSFVEIFEPPMIAISGRAM